MTPKLRLPDVWAPIRRLLSHSPRENSADGLSQIIDAQSDPGEIDDPGLAAILKASSGQALPPDLQTRSWSALERELFSTPAVLPSIQVPYRERRKSVWRPGSALRPGRLVAALALAAAAGAAYVGYGAWNEPHLRGRGVVKETLNAWARTQDYRAAIQFLSRVPGFQMQWSGTEYYAAPGRMRLDMDSMGIPGTMIINGDTGIAETPVPGENIATFRFLARALRMDKLMDQIKNTRDARYEGISDVVGQPCQVISFSLPNPEGARPDAVDLAGQPREMNSARIWISQDLHLPIQVEFYLPDHSVAIAYRFTKILVNVRMRPTLFKLPLTGGRFPPDGTVLRRATVQVEMRSFGIGPR